MGWSKCVPAAILISMVPAAASHAELAVGHLAGIRGVGSVSPNNNAEPVRSPVVQVEDFAHVVLDSPAPPRVFDQTATSSFYDSDPDQTTGFASQKSTVGNTSFKVEGRLAANAGGEATGVRSLFDETYYYFGPSPEPYQYTLKYKFVSNVRNASDLSQGGSLPIPAGTMSLDGTDGFTQPVLLAYDPSGSLEGTTTTIEGTKTGTLTGVSRFILDLQFVAPYVEHIELDYYAEMTFSEVGDAGPGGPTAVPLPPAVWGGLVMLSGIAAGQYYRRRKALAEA